MADDIFDEFTTLKATRGANGSNGIELTLTADAGGYNTTTWLWLSDRQFDEFLAAVREAMEVSRRLPDDGKAHEQLVRGRD